MFGLAMKSITMPQHLKLYCPLRESVVEWENRKGRKVLRPPPLKVESQGTSSTDPNPGQKAKEIKVKAP